MIRKSDFIRFKNEIDLIEKELFILNPRNPIEADKINNLNMRLGEILIEIKRKKFKTTMVLIK